MKTPGQPDDLKSMSMPSVPPSPAGRPACTRPADSTNESAQSFGIALREQRRMRKLSLTQLASLSGMSASYLSRIEHDHLPPPGARIMQRLAMALNTEVEVLQRAAGLVPERIVAIIRDRPMVLTLLTLVARLPDSELFELCEALLARPRHSH